MNLYTQIRAFYSKVFEGNYDIRTTHISLYMFLLNQNNRSNWSEWFKCPFDTGMMGACINSNKTYYNTLNDLEKFGFIKYEKGKNNYKAPKISIVNLSEKFNIPAPEKEESTSVNITPLSTPLLTQLPTQVTTQLDTQLSKQLTTHKDILVTSNFKLVIEEVTNKQDKDLIISKIQDEFYQSLKQFYPEFKKETLREFYDYWSEPNKSKTKIKWQIEKTWDTHKRLLRWVKNDFTKKGNPESKPVPKTIFRDKNDW